MGRQNIESFLPSMFCFDFSEAFLRSSAEFRDFAFLQINLVYCDDSLSEIDCMPDDSVLEILNKSKD